MAKNGSVDDADPLVILVPVDPAPRPLPCNADTDASLYDADGYDAAGAISCAELNLKGVCNSEDPDSRNKTCNGRGDCVNGQCFCDVPYIGFNCSESVGCVYFDEDPDVMDWSTAGCTSAGVIEVNGCEVMSPPPSPEAPPPPPSHHKTTRPTATP